MITMRQLSYFVTVAEELHFGHAAERLHIAQPGLSTQIRALEEDLGVRLLARGKRGVSLTSAGTQFLGEARQTVRQARHAEEIARQASRAALQRVSVGYSGSVPFTGGLRRIFQRLSANHPFAELALTEFSHGQHMERLQDGTIDFAIFHGGNVPRPLGIRTGPLLQEPYDVVMSRKHPLAAHDRICITDLAGQLLIAIGAASGSPMTRSLFDMCRNACFEPRIAYTVEQLGRAVDLAAAGLGLAVVPHSASETQVPEALFRPLAVEDRSSLEFAYRINESAPAALALIREAKRFGSEMKLAGW